MVNSKSKDSGLSANERKGKILKTVVDTYISDPTPVGSKIVSEKVGLDVSPATIRNEMHALEDSGYLMHTHTSSGRIPTDLGYRFFVDNFVAVGQRDEKKTRKSTGEFPVATSVDSASLSKDAVFKQTVLALSTATNHTALLVKDTHRTTNVSDIHISEITDGRLVAALFFDDSSIQRTVIDSQALQDGELADCIYTLKKVVIGKDLKSLRDDLEKSTSGESGWSMLAGKILKACLDDQTASSEEATVHVAGVANVANFELQGEISSHLLTLLEQQMALVELIRNSVDDSIGVKIGSENIYEELSRHSMVLAPFSGLDGESGAIGIIGPTRMDYAKVFSVLSFATQNVSKVLDQK